MGASPQKKKCLIFLKKIFFVKIEKKIPAYLNSPDRPHGTKIGGVGHFGWAGIPTFTPGVGDLLKGYSPGGGNKIWCKPKVVPIKGYNLGESV